MIFHRYHVRDHDELTNTSYFLRWKLQPELKGKELLMQWVTTSLKQHETVPVSLLSSPALEAITVMVKCGSINRCQCRKAVLTRPELWQCFDGDEPWENALQEVDGDDILVAVMKVYDNTIDDDEGISCFFELCHYHTFRWCDDIFGQDINRLCRNLDSCFSWTLKWYVMIIVYNGSLHYEKILVFMLPLNYMIKWR